MDVREVTWEAFTEFFGCPPDEVVAGSIRTRLRHFPVEGVVGHEIIFDRFVFDKDGHWVIEEETSSFVREEKVIRICMKDGIRDEELY